ncbi:hypothetical protein TNIN_499191 [Trichonephila inaurata madagascariensis]|uniref:Uncharacterized protein n=1 Tax=Trichonephila inaurata madagascariensis TaxID=2747483 RepID=A0A8X6WQ10_9ARAC|nr:hypothetical protein TNIN_499191 [Trichonephila inaurata madagascariensis]
MRRKNIFHLHRNHTWGCFISPPPTEPQVFLSGIVLTLPGDRSGKDGGDAHREKSVTRKPSGSFPLTPTKKNEIMHSITVSPPTEQFSLTTLMLRSST